jgi:hypothetical protein
LRGSCAIPPISHRANSPLRGGEARLGGGQANHLAGPIPVLVRMAAAHWLALLSLCRFHPFNLLVDALAHCAWIAA